ncbi:hypothetical protein OSTOST_17886, partial [Ostertagia ostertagi]
MAEEADTYVDVDAKCGGDHGEVKSESCDDGILQNPHGDLVMGRYGGDVEAITMGVKPPVNNTVETNLCSSQVTNPTVHATASTESQPSVQDENRPEEPIVTKPTENLEDLSRLAMFGKQRTVLRRSQIRPEAAGTGAAAAPSESHTSSARRTPIRETPTRSARPPPVANARASNNQRNDPVLSARARLTPSSIRSTLNRPNIRAEGNKPGPVRVTSNANQDVVRAPCASSQSVTSQTGSTVRQHHNLPGGPVTRSRSKELVISSQSETTNKTETVKSDPVAKLAAGVREIRMGSERLARDRAPRTTTSSASARNSQRAAPVRIGRPQVRDAFLNNAAVPSESQFRRDLVNRVSSLGPNQRGSTSTPKDDDKGPSVASVPTNKGQERASSSRLPIRRGSSSAGPPTHRPVVRPPSVTRPVHPPSVARASSVPRATSAPRAPSVPRATSVNRPASVTRVPSVTRPSSVARPASRTDSISRSHRPPSVTRPHFPDTSKQRVPPQSGIPSDSTRTSRAPVSIAATTRSTTTAKGATPSQHSVRHNENSHPLKPRSSVIRSSPVPTKNPGDGTPLRGFCAELRRYPAPSTGSTTNSAVSVSTKTLSKEEERALVTRLAAPKKTATTTPVKISNLQTHGLSCVKIRSRSISTTRRPSSALSSGDVPTSSRMLTFSGTD